MRKISIVSAVFIFSAAFWAAPANALPAGTGEGQRGKVLSQPGREDRFKDKMAAGFMVGELPLHFIANRGQVHADAKYYVRTTGYTLWLTKEGLVFDIIRRSKVKSKGTNDRDVSRLVFVGANKDPGIAAARPGKHRVNYFLGSDPSRWLGDVPTARAVLYKDLYENIDLKVYGMEKQIEYDWIVKPGGSPADIKFQYRDVNGTHIDQAGNLVIETGFGRLFHKKPSAYQVVEARKKGVEVTFTKIAANTYGFSVGRYDKGHTLVIDPVVLLYATYLGGSDRDEGWSTAVDPGGNVYITGRTSSLDFPTQGSYQGDQGIEDVFVSRIDPGQGGADSLVYSTYLGGSGWDGASGISVDSSGNAYVTGDTGSSDFPIRNQYQGPLVPGDDNIFVTRLDTNRSGTDSLVYSTYLGGSSFESSLSIAADESGNAYVTGYTYSPDFPTLNRYQDNQGSSDVFVSRLDTNRAGDASLIYSTYLGGSYEDEGWGTAADQSGNVYVTGWTWGEDFPLRNPFQGAIIGYNYSAFVSRLDTNRAGDASLIYSTYLGGSYQDEGRGIAADQNGNAYVTGWTTSWDFPTRKQFQPHIYGLDAFVSRIDTNRSGDSSLIYSTYLGGMGRDEGSGITAAGSGSVFITGLTGSPDFPNRNGFQSFQGYYDAFVSRIDTDREGDSSLICSTFLGGWDFELGKGIAADRRGNVFVTGYTDSMDFPCRDEYQSFQGSRDAFVAKLAMGDLPTVKTTAVHSVTTTSACCDGEVVSEGAGPVTARGVCWSTAPAPNISNNRTLEGSGTGSFTAFISNLVPNTTFYVRAYAQNLVGTGYGRILQFKTLRNPLISGRVTGHGSGIPGVLLSFSNRGGQAETDLQGNYSHPVEHNWSGTVTPRKAGHVFEPSSRTYENVVSDITGQNYTAFFIVLTLQASRQTESSWLIKRQYGKIHVTVDNQTGIPVYAYLLLRKEGEQDFQLLHALSTEQIQGDSYTYLDTYLDANRVYTYKFVALDEKGKTIAASNVMTI